MNGKHIDVIGCSLLIVALFAPREAIAERKDPNEVGQGCFPIRVQVPDAPRKNQRRALRTPSFSASAILDLEFQMRLPRSTRAHTVEVKFFTPEGHLYQTVSVPVSPEAAADGENRRGRRQAVSVTLPVAGTTIVSSALYGTWKVEAYLDGTLRPCGGTLELAIRP